MTSALGKGVRRTALKAACVGVGGLIAFGVFELAASPAAADTQVEQGSAPLSSVSSTMPVTLAQFDPADGTLEQVTVTLTVAGTTSVDVTNLTPTTKSTTVTVDATASASGPGVTALSASPTASQSQSLASAATFTFGVNASGTQQQVVTSATDLAAFVGAGTITFNVTGLVGADVQGPATWRASGSLGGTATVNVEYQFNDAPVAVADVATVTEDDPATAINVLANDTDADGGAIAIGSVTQPANGTVVITGGGSGLTYQPNLNYCNSQSGGSPDTFTYTLSPGISTATVSVSVTCVDDPPAAVADAGSATEDAVAPLAIDVLANDTDVDGGPISVQSVAQPVNGAAAITGGGTGVSYSPTADFCGVDTFTYTLNGGSAATVTVTVTCVNDAPVVATTAGTTAYVENDPPVPVDAGITVTDDGGIAAATMQITGGLQSSEDVLAFASQFGITPSYDSATGTLTLTGTTTAANYQTALRSVMYVNTSDNPSTATRTVSVQVTDDGALGSNIATRDISVAVGNDAPVVTTTAGSTAYTEGDPATTVDGGVTVTDADDTDLESAIVRILAGFQAGDELLFTDQNGITGSYNAGTGELTMTGTASVTDYQTALRSVTFRTTIDDPATAKTIELSVDDGSTQSALATKGIAITPVNDTPTVNAATVAVDENSATGTAVHMVTFTDPDAGQAHTFAITAGNAGGAFAINPSTGAITVAGALDFETTSTYSVTVQVTDDGTPALFGTATITVDVNDVNEAPIVTTPLVVVALDENSANGTVVHDVGFTDVDGGQTHTFAITAGNTGGAFAINPSTGQITVADSSALDFETSPSFVLTVQVTDDGTPALSATGTITVNLNDVNDAPAVNAATFGVDEDAAAGAAVGTVAFADDDAGQTHTFAITAGNTGGALAINPSTGVITVAGALDFETTATYGLTVEVTDNGTPTLSGTATITINISDVNEAPVVNAATFNVDEDAAPGESVGTVTFNDVDAGQTHTFAITAGNTAGAFTINPSTGAITVVGALDFETATSYSLTVEVTDDGTPPLSGTATITIDVNDVNEAPVVDAATLPIDENSANGTTVHTVTFDDVDAGQTHTFAITAGNTGGAFTIDPSTGAITVATGTALDFETTPTFALSVQVTDNGTPPLSGTATVTVDLNDVNEAPSILAPTTASVERDITSTIAGISVDDPDAGDIELTLVVDNGTIDVDETASAAVVSGDGTDTVVITGPVAEINAILSALNGVTYLNDAGFAGLTDSLHLDIDDLGTPALTASATVMLQFNQPPVAATGSDTTNEDSSKTLTLSGSDADDDNLTFVIPATTTEGGTLTSPGAPDCSAADVCTQTILYTPALNFNGTDTFTFTVDDGLNPSPSAAFTITVDPVNDAPTVTASFGTTTFTEDGGPVVVDAGLVVGDIDDTMLESAAVTISGLADVAAETLDATLSGGVTAKNFAAGTLTLSGTATLAEYQAVLRTVVYNNSDQDPTVGPRSINFVVNDGTLTSATATRSLNVIAVNDAPVVTTSAGTVAYTENGSPVAIDPALTVADVDSANLVSGTVTITGNAAAGDVLGFTPANGITDTNPAADVLALSGTTTVANWQSVLRSVTYATASDNPSTLDRTISFQVDDGAASNNLSNVATRTVTITPVNDAPVITLSGSTPSYTENGPAVTVDGGLAVADVDDTNLESGTVSITGGLVAGDTLTFTPAGGITDTNAAADVLVLSGTATVAEWQSVLQSVQYSSTSDNPSNATRIVTFVVSDGGLNSNSAPKNVTVVPVNDAPVLTQPDAGALSYTENAAPTAIAPNITAADVDSANLVSATITIGTGYVNGQDVLSLGTNPQNGITAAAFNAATGTLTLSGSATVANYQTALRDVRYANASDNPTPDPRTISFQVNDGGAVNNLSNIVSRTVTVLPVNDPPTAGADSFDTIGNTELRVDLAAGTTPTVTEATGAANGVRGNDADHPAENDPFTVTSIVGCADVTAPYDCTVGGGAVSMTADGDFSFIPSPTLASGTPTDTTFQYVVTDQPTVGAPAAATGTVTIHVYDKVWYVRQGATGNGTSTTPLGSFTGIAAGDGSDSDVAGDYIFVHNSGALTSSIVLEANQHLLGEGVGLSINRDLNANGAPANLVAAGVRPAITSAINTVGVTAAVPIEIRGLSLASTSGNAIDLTSAAALSGSASLAISDNTVTGATLEGIDINLNAGTTGSLNLAVSDNTLSATSTALDITRNAGTLTITAFHDNTVSGSSAAGGIAVTGTGAVVTFDQTPGGGIDPVPGGTTVIGASGDRIGGPGLVLSNVAGNLNLANAAAGTIAAGDLDVLTDAGAALNITGGAGGFTFNVTDNAGTLVSNAGPAALITTAAVDLDLALLTSNASTLQGVSLTTVTGSFSAPSGSSITNPANTGFLVSGGTATVTYGGTLSDSVDTAGTQLLVQITGSTAGTKTFSGAVTDSQAGDDGGISLTTNTGTTISFSGALTISTATAPAFTVTGGGTVTATGTGSTLTTTTAAALNVANTNIGAADLIFQSISAGTAGSGPANGIVLNNTGAAGGLTVTGNGGACNPGTPTCTGGTIQNTTGGDDSGPTPAGTGIVLNNTQQVSLTNMRVRQNTNYGIRGDDVTGFSFVNGLIDGVNGTNVATPFNDGSINLDRVVGSISITGSDISGGFQRNIKIDHPATDASATATVTITGNTIHDTSASLGDDGVGIEAENNDNYTINVSNNTFSRHGGDHINVSMINNAIVDVTINANTTSGGHPTGLGQGILVFGASWNGTGTYDVTNNTMNGNKQGGAIHMNKGSGTATMSGTISGNTIGTSGVPLSGSEQAFGIIIGSRGAGGSHTALISNNTIRQYFDRGIVVQLGEGNSTLNATVTGNTVDEFGDAVNSLHGIHFDLGILAADAGAACLDIGGSTAALRNHVTNAANEAAGGVDIRLRRGSLISLQLRGYTGGSEDDAAVNTYLLGRNDATTVSATSPGTGTTTNTPSGNACPLPA